jgi:hypothetical protein
MGVGQMQDGSLSATLALLEDPGLAYRLDRLER